MRSLRNKVAWLWNGYTDEEEVNKMYPFRFSYEQRRVMGWQ